MTNTSSFFLIFTSFKALSRFKHFHPSYFQDQAFSSKILPRSDIFFQVTSKIREFLPSYFQDQIFSCKILQDQTFSSKIFQDTCKNNALSCKILEVKSDRFLQKMYGSSTGVIITQNHLGNYCFEVVIKTNVSALRFILILSNFPSLSCTVSKYALRNNKTGTSQVGAISKAQKAQNIFFGKNLKFSK